MLCTYTHLASRTNGGWISPLAYLPNQSVDVVVLRLGSLDSHSNPAVCRDWFRDEARNRLVPLHSSAPDFQPVQSPLETLVVVTLSKIRKQVETRQGFARLMTNTLAYLMDSIASLDVIIIQNDMVLSVSIMLLPDAHSIENAPHAPTQPPITFPPACRAKAFPIRETLQGLEYVEDQA